jgi:DnaJ family protein C protein 11
MPLLPPPVTVSLSRQLFRDSLTEGTITVHTGSAPYVTFDIISPTFYNFTMDRHPNHPTSPRTAVSRTGFALWKEYWTYGATLDGLNSRLRASIACTFTELALQIKLGVELGLTGLGLMLTGTWKNELSEISTSVGLDAQGVVMKLEWVCPTSDILDGFAYELHGAQSLVSGAAIIITYNTLSRLRRRSCIVHNSDPIRSFSDRIPFLFETSTACAKSQVSRPSFF